MDKQQIKTLLENLKRLFDEAPEGLRETYQIHYYELLEVLRGLN